MFKLSLLSALLFLPITLSAQTSDGESSFQERHFDLVATQPTYSTEVGYGYDILPAPTKDSTAPFYFSVKVPDGNYKITVELGSKRRASHNTIKAESRRLMLENISTAKGQIVTQEFVVNKRSPQISADRNVRLKAREHGYLNWDDKLTIEFNGNAPAVRSIHIERQDSCPTIYLCGNSTVVDQNSEPWASWGQMIPRWFNSHVAFSNHAESGLATSSFLAQRRLEKIMTTLKAGDYVIIEFGHNDQKENKPGSGAYYNFAHNLKIFIDNIRSRGATPIFCTPTQRRHFDRNHQHIVDTHGDYPAAIREVAHRENVALIDLHQQTRVLFETLGYDDSRRALVHYPANTFPNQPKPLADNTHFNTYGAYQVAKLVVMGLKDCAPALTSHLRPDFVNFSPLRPDDFNNFHIAPTPNVELTTPDGN